MEGERRCYATMVTSDSYLPGVQVLLKSLQRQGCSYPLVVIASESLPPSTKKRMQRLGIDVRSVCDLAAPAEQTRRDACWANSQYTKLHIWNLVDFDKVVYVDADCLVCECIDELFELATDFAAAPDVFPPDRFNAGVLVIKPSVEVFDKLVSLIPSTASYDGGDTGFLNAIFSDWFSSEASRRLPYRYNAQRTMYWFTKKNPGYWQAIQPVKVIHFSSSPKPWESNPLVAGKVGELEQLWWDTFLSQ